MSKIFKVEVEGSEIVGRLVGFIDDKECVALINSDNAPKKVFTSESTTIQENAGHVSNRRFVMAIKNGDENIGPALFISPKIMSISWRNGIPELHCEDKKDYKFIEKE